MSSFGDSLRRERELREITLREISEATKINIRYLEALEANDFRHLPGGVFNKGFVRAYAQFVGIDVDATINSYLLEERQQSAPETGLDPGTMRGPAVAAGGSRTHPADSRRLSPAVIIGAVVLIAAVIAGVVLLWPSNDSDGPTSAPAVSEPVGTGSSDVKAPAPPPVETADTPEEAVVDDAVAEVPERPAEAVAEPSPAPIRTLPATEPPPPVVTGGVAVVELARATRGRVNCDNRRIEILAGMAAGTRLDFTCEAFLIVDAEDAGAVHAGIPGGPLTPIGPDGEAIRGRVIPLHASRSL